MDARGAHGRDDRPVDDLQRAKSISRETTFERDLHAVRDRSTLSAIFTELVHRTRGRPREQGYAGKTIGIKLRFDDFKIVTRDLTLPGAPPHDGCAHHPSRSRRVPQRVI